MENVIKYFDNIETGFRRMKFLTLSALMVAAAIASGSMWMAYRFAEASRNNIFVVDKSGSALAATLADSDAQKDLEVKDHMIRFHELMFNLSPSSEAIKRLSLIHI